MFISVLSKSVPAVAASALVLQFAASALPGVIRIDTLGWAFAAALVISAVHTVIAVHGYGRAGMFTTILLGGGNRLLWAPAFPLWLDAPGAWDPIQYYNIEHGPVYTWTLLDERGTSLALRSVRRRLRRACKIPLARGCPCARCT